MLASTNFSNGGLGASIKTSFKDFVSGVREYTVLFFVAICLIVLFLGFTTYKMPFASKKQSIKHYLMMKKNPYKTTGNILGNEKGKIKVDIYTDYACPHCFVYNIMLHQVVRENKEILVRHHNFPLDKECNKYIDEQMHEGACRLARYAIASENQGKYWEMASMLFETQPKSDKEVMELAKGLKFDVKRFRADISSRETQKRLNQEIEEGILNGVDGTPTLVVNGKHYIGLKPYYEFKRIIMER
jgi:protein-disulfide isomerase